jgi:predicted metal-binding protein
VKRALAAGAEDAKLIPANTIVTGEWVRFKCQYGCGGYGRCLTCPPYSPTPEETAKILSEYEKAVLVRTDGHTSVRSIVIELEREAFLDGYYKALAMGAGPCDLCKACPAEEEDCPHRDRARPSMEACGIDVFQTARSNGLPIQVVKDYDCPQNYYGIVLLE